MRKKSIITILLFSASVAALTASFFQNRWLIVDENKFDEFESYSESLVIGRLVKSAQDGVFSHAAMLGRVTDSNKNLSGADLRAYQYEMYLNDLEGDGYSGYLTQSGLKTIILSIVDEVLPYDPSTKLRIYLFFNSFMMAVTMSLLCLWIYKELGLLASLFSFFAILFSIDITYLAKNLWWLLWTYFLPLMTLIAFFFFSKKKENDRIKYKYIFVLVFLSVLFKILLTGMDFITGILVMMVIPIIYYEIKDGYHWKKIFDELAISAIATFLAVVLSLTILAWQISLVKGGGIESGWNHIIYSLKKRSYGSIEELEKLSYGSQKVYEDSLNASLGDFMPYYLEKTIINVKLFEWDSLQVSASQLLWLTIGLSIFSIILMFFLRHEILRRKTIGFIVVAWVSFFGSLSWLIIFKSHSYIHRHMNSIVWHLPYSIFVGAFCGLCLYLVIHIVKNRLEEKNRN